MSTILLVAMLSLPQQKTKWVTVKPVRIESRFSETINDIESQVPEGTAIGQAGMYRSPDRVTHAHEMTHAANSRLTNCAKREEGGGYCLYLGNGRAFIFGRVPCKLSTVARRIQPAWRDSIYKLYLVEMQTHWENEPHYILDEALAYLMGTRAGLEYRSYDRAGHSLENAVKLYRFGVAFSNIVKRNDVDEFLKWYRAALNETMKECEAVGIRTARQKNLLAVIQARPTYAPKSEWYPANGGGPIYSTPRPVSDWHPSGCANGQCPPR